MKFSRPRFPLSFVNVESITISFFSTGIGSGIIPTRYRGSGQAQKYPSLLAVKPRMDWSGVMNFQSYGTPRHFSITAYGSNGFILCNRSSSNNRRVSSANCSSNSSDRNGTGTISPCSPKLRIGRESSMRASIRASISSAPCSSVLQGAQSHASSRHPKSEYLSQNAEPPAHARFP